MNATALAKTACILAAGITFAGAAPRVLADGTAASAVESVLLAPEVDVAALDWSRQANGRAGAILLELLGDERKALGLRVRAAEALGAVPTRAAAAGLLAVLGKSPAPAIARAALLSLGRVLSGVAADAPEHGGFQIAFRAALGNRAAAVRGAAASAAAAVLVANSAAIASVRAQLAAALGRETHAGARREIARALSSLPASQAGGAPAATDPLGARRAPPRRGPGSATPSR